MDASSTFQLLVNDGFKLGIERTIPAADQGPNTYPAAIVNYPECPPELRADKRRIKASVTRLLRSGQVRQETYKNSQRKEATRLVLRS